MLRDAVPFKEISVIFFMVRRTYSSPIFAAILHFSVVSSVSSLDYSPSASFFPIPTTTVACSQSMVRAETSIIYTDTYTWLHTGSPDSPANRCFLDVVSPSQLMGVSDKSPSQVHDILQVSFKAAVLPESSVLHAVPITFV